MPIFKSKDKSGNISVNFAMANGISKIEKGIAINVTLDHDILTIKKRLSKDEPYKLSVSKITDVSILSETEIAEKQKSVAGRAMVGGLFLGPLGAIVGGMSGIGSKKQSQNHLYFIINYTSNEELKVLSFEIVPATMGHKKMYDALKSKIPASADNREL